MNAELEQPFTPIELAQTQQMSPETKGASV